MYNWAINVIVITKSMTKLCNTHTQLQNDSLYCWHVDRSMHASVERVVGNSKTFSKTYSYS
jgi:hypothetical protein